MNVNQNTEQKSMNLEWQALWEVTKQWAVMSQWEKDLEDYQERNENILRGYN